MRKMFTPSIFNESNVCISIEHYYNIKFPYLKIKKCIHRLYDFLHYPFMKGTKNNSLFLPHEPEKFNR